MKWYVVIILLGALLSALASAGQAIKRDYPASLLLGYLFLLSLTVAIIMTLGGK